MIWAAIIHFVKRLTGWILFLPLFLAMVACKAVAIVAPTPEIQLPPTITATAVEISPSPAVTATTPATSTHLPPPTTTDTPTQAGFEVRYHPDGGLFTGDLVSMEVISPSGIDTSDLQVSVSVDGARQAQAGFAPYGIAGRTQATLLWVWDTSGLAPGSYQLTFSIEPGGPEWTESVTLLPQDALPFPGSQASWAVAESDCCLVYYITNTAAERDLDALLDLLDNQSVSAVEMMGIELNEPIQVTFLPRVLGHGGFAANGVWISYLDRNYTGSNSEIVFHHEMIHVLDSRLGGELRPSLLVEGLAVYLSGGHFKREPLIQRAAALLPAEPGCMPVDQAASALPANQDVCGLGQYIQLTGLVDDFYAAQHEISYLQAGALVEYMVDRWGWEAYSAFYRDIHNQPLPAEDVQEVGGPQYQAINAALQEHFDRTFEQLEQDFLELLSQERVTLEAVHDVQMTTLYYDTLRRYQQLMDPSAYFATAWLLDGEQMRDRGIVADYVRQPLEAENLALELMLLSANQDLLNGRYDKAENKLVVIDLILDRIEQEDAQPFAVHPDAQDYLLLVKAAQQAGFIPQIIDLENDVARVWANLDSPQLVELQFYRQMQNWQMTSSLLSSLLWTTE